MTMIAGVRSPKLGLDVGDQLIGLIDEVEAGQDGFQSALAVLPEHEGLPRCVQMPATCRPTLTMALPKLGYTKVSPNPTVQLYAFEQRISFEILCPAEKLVYFYIGQDRAIDDFAHKGKT